MNADIFTMNSMLDEIDWWLLIVPYKIELNSVFQVKLWGLVTGKRVGKNTLNKNIHGVQVLTTFNILNTL